VCSKLCQLLVHRNKKETLCKIRIIPAYSLILNTCPVMKATLKSSYNKFDVILTVHRR